MTCQSSLQYNGGEPVRCDEPAGHKCPHGNDAAGWTWTDVGAVRVTGRCAQ